MYEKADSISFIINLRALRVKGNRRVISEAILTRKGKLNEWIQYRRTVYYLWGVIAFLCDRNIVIIARLFFSKNLL